MLFAIALCGNPELLFFDEPTTGQLRDAHVSAFSRVDASTDVQVFVYPLIADVTAGRR